MRQAQIKIGFFTNALARGGAEEHMLTLLCGFDRRWFRLFLICPTALVELLKNDLPPDVAVVQIELGKLSDLGGAAHLAQFLRRERLDVLHSHLFYSSLFASPIGRLCGVPAIIETPHVSENWRKGWKSSFLVDRAASRCVDRFIAVSQANRDYLVNTKGLPARKIEVIHNGCNLSRFDPCHRAPAGMKASLGFAESDPILLIVGRLEPQKGHHVMLDALPRLASEFTGLRLVCLGEGVLRSELEAHVKKLKLSDAVRFIGYQANVPDWLALATVVVLPSYYEGLPLVAIETLGAGRPLVATSVDGTPEVVLDGRTGLLVPPGDPSRLGAAIGRVLRDPLFGEQLARGGRNWVQQNFSEEQQIRATEEMYCRLLKRPHSEPIDSRSGQCEFIEEAK